MDQHHLPPATTTITDLTTTFYIILGIFIAVAIIIWALWDYKKQKKKMLQKMPQGIPQGTPQATQPTPTESKTESKGDHS